VGVGASVLLVVPSAFAANRDAQPPDGVPGVVTIVGAGPGGGSKAVLLTWQALANASGYRVHRSDTADGAFEVTAELDVTTGAATASADVVNVFSGQHSYIPPGGTFEGPDQSPQFSYVDVGPRQRCFRVIAFNTPGEGPASDVACGAPPGVEPEPPTTTTTAALPPTTTTVAPGQPNTTAPPETPTTAAPDRPRTLPPTTASPERPTRDARGRPGTLPPAAAPAAPVPSVPNYAG
jgi:hypothetical protein